MTENNASSGVFSTKCRFFPNQYFSLNKKVSAFKCSFYDQNTENF